MKLSLCDGRQIHISEDMSGKLSGIIAISSDCTNNDLCIARRSTPGSICEHCYAAGLQAMRKELNNATRENGEILSSCIYHAGSFNGAFIGRSFGRIEPFGDTQNVIHAINYVQLAYDNNNTRVAAWSKNPRHYGSAFLAIGKPSNMAMVHSSLFENKNDFFDVVKPEIQHFYDTIFTVYTADFALWNGVTINCGGMQCIRDCGAKCYTYRRKTAADPLRIVNECKKNEYPRYTRALDWIRAGKNVNVYIFQDIETKETKAYVTNKVLRGIPGNVKNSDLLYSSTNENYKFGVIRLRLAMKDHSVDIVPCYLF